MGIVASEEFLHDLASGSYPHLPQERHTDRARKWSSWVSHNRKKNAGPSRAKSIIDRRPRMGLRKYRTENIGEQAVTVLFDNKSKLKVEGWEIEKKFLQHLDFETGMLQFQTKQRILQHLDSSENLEKISRKSAGNHQGIIRKSSGNHEIVFFFFLTQPVIFWIEWPSL